MDTSKYIGQGFCAGLSGKGLDKNPHLQSSELWLKGWKMGLEEREKTQKEEEKPKK